MVLQSSSLGYGPCHLANAHYLSKGPFRESLSLFLQVGKKCESALSVSIPRPVFEQERLFLTFSVRKLPGCGLLLTFKDIRWPRLNYHYEGCTSTRFGFLWICFCCPLCGLDSCAHILKMNPPDWPVIAGAQICYRSDRPRPRISIFLKGSPWHRMYEDIPLWGQTAKETCQRF